MPLRQWQEVQEVLREMREIEMLQSTKRIEYRNGNLQTPVEKRGAGRLKTVALTRGRKRAPGGAPEDAASELVWMAASPAYGHMSWLAAMREPSSGCRRVAIRFSDR